MGVVSHDAKDLHKSASEKELSEINLLSIIHNLHQPEEARTDACLCFQSEKCLHDFACRRGGSRSRIKDVPSIPLVFCDRQCRRPPGGTEDPSAVNGKERKRKRVS